ncbi:MAG: nucleotidyltransferase domain-containing protein [Acidimicrobiales bacterium]|nr:nucleotidyltransferase domain-containing protein [Acidimicrobiales bacterium]
MRRRAGVDDEGFLRDLAERLAGVRGVVAVALGGSRAWGEHRPDSDWDLGIYYRGRLDVEGVRGLGFSGQVFAPGDWGGGVMNGGAWLDVDGRRVDLVYRDLDDVERWWTEARAGRFAIERLPFHLAGVPTYLVVGELARCRVLAGALPRPDFPDPLRRTAHHEWHSAALLSVGFAEAAFAAQGDPLGCAGNLARAVMEEAHARLAARGEWALNEKRIVAQAGLAHLRWRFATLGAGPDELGAACAEVRAALLDER